MGIKQSRSGRISTTQLANGRPFWDGVSSHLAAPLRRGFFGRLPFQLNRSPSEAAVSQSNCRLLIVGGRHLLRIIFVLLQLNLAWRRRCCYGELSRGAACS
jgi:hypothetical protein